MCGIAGIFAYLDVAPPVDRAELARMNARMAPRGPDGSGDWFSADGRVGFTHRRLAIIDLSERGAQPMHSADGTLTITFNGEIYNYRELKAELEAKGYRFRSDSDTEVLLQLYADRGPVDGRGAARHVRLRALGCAASGSCCWRAIRSASSRSTTPTTAGRCASPRRPRRCWPAARCRAIPIRRASSASICSAACPSRSPCGATSASVPAGATVLVDAAGPHAPRRLLQRRAVARPPRRRRHRRRRRAPAAAAPRCTIRCAIISSPTCRSRSSCRPASIRARCSAPWPSSARAIRSPSRCPSPSSRAKRHDEAPLAAEIAARYGARHVVRTVDRAEFERDLPAILDAMDLPTIDGINTWFVAKAAREAGIKVALSGLGADECFGGYPSFRDVPRSVHLAAAVPLRAGPRRAGAPAAVVGASPSGAQLHPKSAGVLQYGGDWAGAYLLRRSVYMPWELDGLLDPALVEEGLRRLAPLSHIAAELQAGRRARRLRPRRGARDLALHAQPAAARRRLGRHGALDRDPRALRRSVLPRRACRRATCWPRSRRRKRWPTCRSRRCPTRAATAPRPASSRRSAAGCATPRGAVGRRELLHRLARLGAARLAGRLDRLGAA